MVRSFYLRGMNSAGHDPAAIIAKCHIAELRGDYKQAPSQPSSANAKDLPGVCWLRVGSCSLVFCRAQGIHSICSREKVHFWPTVPVTTTLRVEGSRPLYTHCPALARFVCGAILLSEPCLLRSLRL